MTSLYLLAPLFLVIAFLYSSVGLGGGSAYIAVLALSGVPYTVIPMIALFLNLIVSGLSWAGYFRAGHFQVRTLLPFAVTSIPMAHLGGLIPLSEKPFYLILGAVLFLAALRIFISNEIQPLQRKISPAGKWLAALGIGAVLGLLAGMVGIGGGIFLGPVLLLLHLANAKQTAAITSAFIFLNSLSGFLAHLSRQPPVWSLLLPFMAVVLLGAQLGSYTGANLLSLRQLQKTLGALLLVASIMVGSKIL